MSRASREAWIVVDLGFGDAGKGTTVDYLARARGAGLVVRFNGGGQAGHNVVTEDGRHHCFSQLGAASFVPGALTHLGPETVLHPTALAVEAGYLARAGVRGALERLTVDARALVTTPYHQAAGRLRELSRGASAHGTCGVGVGETVRDALAAGEEALRCADLRRGGDALRAALERTRKRVWADVHEAGAAGAGGPAADRERAVFTDPGVVGRWLEAALAIEPRARVVDPGEAARRAREVEVVVCEGAQGVLLDQDFGFHPHTTWSDCTTRGARRALDELGFEGETRALGVLRTYVTRHGAGPLPTETASLDHLAEPHNDAAGWQGEFRRGAADLALWRYASEVAGGVDGLVVTHVDALPQAGEWPMCRGYRWAESEVDRALLDGDPQASGRLAVDARALERPPSQGLSPHSPSVDPSRQSAWLERQAALSEALGGARPVLERVRGPNLAAEVVGRIAEHLRRPVWLLSGGPTAGDKEPRGVLARCPRAAPLAQPP